MSERIEEVDEDKEEVVVVEESERERLNFYSKPIELEKQFFVSQF